jgi:16S rRNA (guanine966-N2)-methyltransferase
VLLVERDPRLARRLRESQQRLAATALRVEVADALAFMRRANPGSYELVFIDPPFDAGLFEAALEAAARLVVPGGFVYLEADHAFDEAAVAPLRLHRHARAGNVHFHLLQRDDAPAEGGTAG